MDGEQKSVCYMILGSGLLFVILVISLMAIDAHRDIKMFENGYEEVAIPGSAKLVWQKVKK